ncbi:MAG: glycoside hydrolase family 43 protein, partial [Reichenbachiella sp.]
DLGGKEVGYRYPTPHLPIDSGTFSQGNFTTIFDFTTEFLGFEWLYLRTPDAPLKTNQEGLHLPLKSHDVLSNGSPSFMAHRQRHLKSSAATKLDFTPVGEEEQAGLMIFQNEKYFYYLCQSKSGADEVVQLLKSEGELMVVLEELKLADSADIELKIEADGEYYSFYYRDGSKNSWITVKDHVDARYLSTKEAGGFVGAMYAMYATSSKEDSKSTAFYKSFTY